jgi:ubiquinone biosynthesis accessory factor UbiJ
LRPDSFLAKATPAVAFCFLLNQILERESWARARLARFAGQSIELAPPLGTPLRVAIAADGRVEEGGDPPAARISLRGIEGAAPLADELRALARELRWDFEEELSRVMGDVAAQRVGDAARALGRWPADAAERLAGALAAYATDEARLAVPRTALAPLAGEIASLQAALAALEQRIARLA